MDDAAWGKLLGRSLPAQTTKVLVAVSGGVDSVALLHLLMRLFRDSKIAVEAAHLDHGIRPTSREDASFVADLCQRWECCLHTSACDVPQLAADSGVSLEMAGRQARRDFLARLADQTGADPVALAHHRNDQVETFLMRLARGSGLSGLAAMRSHTGRWWRPLLTVSRAEILAYARQHQLNWVEDASNRDLSFLRNRIRHQLIPQLEGLNPCSLDNISTTIAQVQREEDYWQQLVSRVFHTVGQQQDGELWLSRTALLDQHPALRLRFYREALRRCRGHLQGIAEVHLQAIEGLLSGATVQAQLDLPAAWVARRYERLWFRTDPPAVPEPFDLDLPVPGRLTLPDGGSLVVSLQARPQGESFQVAEFSSDLLGESLRVRTWLPGDRLAPAGMAGRKRLKELFAELRLSHEERAQVPLLVAGDRVLWVVGLRRSRLALATASDTGVLRLEFQPGPPKTDN